MRLFAKASFYACTALAAVLSSRTAAAAEGEKVVLWPAGAPGALGHHEADRPSLTVYRAQPVKATGTAVVVCPGGGYGHLALDHEGRQIAEWLNALGVSAFVLQYRIAPRYHHPAPLTDAQRALRLVRSRAADWGIDPKRIGIWGFSAGGHLASSAGTHFDNGNPSADDPIDRTSCRPDFLILGYPVITLEGPYAHAGSRSNLLGKEPDPRLVEQLSNDKQVTSATPPTFLMHTTTDRPVPPENSVLFYLALHKAGVPAELHIFANGPHGVGLAKNDPVLSRWPALLAAWLKSQGFLERKTVPSVSK